MLTSLTPDQWAAVDAAREATLSRVLEGRVTVEELEAAAAACYATIGEEAPLVVVAPGPVAALLWSALLSDPQLDPQFDGQLYGQLGDQLVGQLYGQLRVQLGGQLVGQLGGQLGQLYHQHYRQFHGQLRDQLVGQLRGQLDGRQLRDQLVGQLGGQLGGQLYDQLYRQFHGQLRDQLYGQLDDQLYDQHYRQFHGQLRDQLYGQLDDQLYDQLGGLRGQLDGVMWSGWRLAWVDHWRHVATIDGITPPGADVMAEADSWATLLTPAFTIPLRGVLVVCGHWSDLHRDRDGRLHSPAGPAWSWPDGTEVWALDGIRVPSWVVTDPDPARILTELDNTEQRRVALAHFGWHRVPDALDLDLVHDSGDPHLGTLWRLPESVGDGLASLLVARNYSPHRDGTWADYGLLVDSGCATAEQAQAWLAGLDVDQWLALDGAS